MGNANTQLENHNTNLPTGSALAAIADANAETKIAYQNYLENSDDIPVSISINTGVMTREGYENPPPLVRQTHRKCISEACRTVVSEYTHNFCFKCCRPGDIEWGYHTKKS